MKANKKYILSVVILLSYMLPGVISNMVSAQEVKHHIVYHDQDGSIIQRIPFTENYQFDEDLPPFFVELPYKNVAWNTKADGSGTSYTKSSTPLTSLSDDLNVYAKLEMGHFVRFDSRGGTPIEYQFVFSGGKAVQPVDPIRSGYDFSGWSLTEGGAVFDFNTVITEDIHLTATWTPKEVTYMVRVWLEKASHPNRSDIDDAIANVSNDYSYSTSFLKTGVTDQNVEFTAADQNKDQIQSLIFRKTNAGMNPDRIQIYFYDDNDYSYAKSLTENDIKSVNDNGGIAGDGTTIINVYYRRYYWMAKLYSNSNNLVSQGVQKDMPGWTFELRNGESVKNALSRKKYDERTSYFNQMNELYPTFMTWASKDITKDPFIFRIASHDGYYDGTYQDLMSRTFDVLSMQNAGRFTPGCYFKDKDQLDLRLEDANNKGDYEWHRYHFVQTIESARANNETDYTHANEANFELKRENVYWYNYSDYNTLCSWSNTPLSGCSYYFIQSVKRDDSGNIVDYYTAKILGDGYDGRPHPYSGSSTYPGMPYRLELYLLRNKYYVDFETYDFVTYKAPNPPQQSVVFEDELSRVASGIKTTDADGNEIRFIIDETQFKDSKEVVWIFKGWYDNELFLGNPIDFTTTKLKMNASTMHFYAKWEPKTITAEYDGNGGKVEGQERIEKPQPSGVIPIRPADPVAPEGMFFYCWTVNGKPYYFEDPIYDDTELVAQYYSDSNQNKMTYAEGKGQGEVPEDANFYLLNANAGVLPPGDGLIPPHGEVFDSWEDAEGAKYTPGDDIIIKGNTTLTALYKDGMAHIVIKRTGLKPGESAIYTVCKDGAATPIHTVSLTGTSAAEVNRTIVKLDPGTYTVTENSWNWAYTKDNASVAPDAQKISVGIATGTGTLDYNQTLTFTFSGPEEEETVKHGEDARVNSMTQSD